MADATSRAADLAAAREHLDWLLFQPGSARNAIQDFIRAVVEIRLQDGVWPDKTGTANIDGNSEPDPGPHWSEPPQDSTSSYLP